MVADAVRGGGLENLYYPVSNRTANSYFNLYSAMKIQFKQQPLPNFGMASECPLLSQKVVKNTVILCDNIFMQNSIFSVYQYDDQRQI